MAWEYASLQPSQCVLYYQMEFSVRNKFNEKLMNEIQAWVAANCQMFRKLNSSAHSALYILDTGDAARLRLELNV
jgi:hypothetical protein